MTDSNRRTRERSLSGDFDSDGDSPHEQQDDAPSGKPGRKKNPNSQAARRDQNRIAQREFRLRKQQRIRDLEARVEILSGGKDEALSEMRNILKDLMAENHALRGFLRSLTEFIGDGAGGLLSKLGWSMQDFDNFVNKSETDTAYESYQRRKRDGQPTSSASQTAPRKRASEEDTSNNPKRPRGHSERDDADRADAFPVLMPMNSVPSGSNLYTGRSSQDASLFSEIMRGPNGSPILLPGPSSPSYPTSSSQVPSSNGNYQNSYVSPLNMSVETNTMNTISFVNNASTPTIPQQSRPSVASLDEYHLDNYKRNSAYCRFNLVDCLHDFASAVTIHGDDVLAHANWEIGESWLRRYGSNTLSVSNKWRREHGLPELRMVDIAPEQQQTST
ncbi:hypothetical protein EDB83DRAFT_2504602 [Lactarius deliciosus]|nr:hypothetical protein EDB83DRAFT_2504602 [Lactarius deliciosus]